MGLHLLLWRALPDGSGGSRVVAAVSAGAACVGVLTVTVLFQLPKLAERRAARVVRLERTQAAVFAFEEDGTVRALDAASGKTLETWRAPSGVGPHAIFVSPQGRGVAWNTAAGAFGATWPVREARPLAATGEVMLVRGEVAVLREGTRLHLVPLDGGPARSFHVGASVAAVALDAGEQLVVADVQGLVRWIDLATGEPVARVSVSPRVDALVATGVSGYAFARRHQAGWVRLSRDDAVAAPLARAGSTAALAPLGRRAVAFALGPEVYAVDVVSLQQRNDFNHGRTVVALSGDGLTEDLVVRLEDEAWLAPQARYVGGVSQERRLLP